MRKRFSPVGVTGIEELEVTDGEAGEIKVFVRFVMAEGLLEEAPFRKHHYEEGQAQSGAKELKVGPVNLIQLVIQVAGGM
nr:hypothetical protein HmN_000924300 [Hymenolepis microstoma]